MRNILVLSWVALTCGAACAPEHHDALRIGLEAGTTIPGLSQAQVAVEGVDLSVAASSRGPLVGVPALELDDQRVGGVIPYQKSGEEWLPQDVLFAPEPLDLQRFGATLSSDGDSVAVGGPYPAAGSGKVWLYDFNRAWVAAPSAVLAPPAGPELEPGFGRSLSLTPSLLAVGSETATSGDGRAYIFEKQAGEWSDPIPIAPAEGPITDAVFGWSVAAHGDTVVVGAPGVGAAGAVFIFERASNWADPQVIRGFEDAGAAPQAAFGRALALDASHLFVGAPGDQAGEGRVYGWVKDANGGWDPKATLASKRGSVPDAAEGDSFGKTLGIALGRVFIGVPSADVSIGRVQAFALDTLDTEEARLSPESGADVLYFGDNLATSSSSVVVSSLGRDEGSLSRVFYYALEQGAGCTADSDCTTGHCVDAVCCDTACEELCSSCSAELKGGGPSGVCGPVAVGTDPRDGCDDQKPCGTTGECDGKGACTLAGKSVSCAPPGCVSQTEARAASYCDGLGSCVSAPVEECQPGYACSAGSCAQSCEENTDCADGSYCLGAACVSGARCSDDGLTAYDDDGVTSECTEARCADGACQTSCSQTTDCISGVCHPTRRVCVAASELPLSTSTAGGCSCRLATRAKYPPLEGWAGVVGILLVSLRRCQRARRFAIS